MYDKLSGAHLEVKPQDYMSEHQTVRSRLTGKNVEISFLPLPAAANRQRRTGARKSFCESKTRRIHAHAPGSPWKDGTCRMGPRN